MYSNNIANFEESTTILNSCTKKVWKLIVYPSYVPFCFIQKFCNILGTWVTVRLLRILRPRSWKWPTRLDFEDQELNLILSERYSPDLPLDGLEHGLGIHTFNHTCACQIVVARATHAKFLQQSGHSILNNGAFNFRKTNISGSLLPRHHGPVRTCNDYVTCSFVQGFTSYTERKHAKRVSAQTTSILPTTTDTYLGFNCFSNVIYAQQVSIYQNARKLFTPPGNIWTFFPFRKYHERGLIILVALGPTYSSSSAKQGKCHDRIPRWMLRIFHWMDWD